MSRRIVVSATWDEEACVWVAESADLPGLVTEATSVDALLVKLPEMIRDLLEFEADDDESSLDLVLPDVGRLYDARAA